MADVVQLNARLAAALKARADLEAQLTLPEVLADHTALARRVGEGRSTDKPPDAGDVDDRPAALAQSRRGGLCALQGCARSDVIGCCHGCRDRPGRIAPRGGTFTLDVWSI